MFGQNIMDHLFGNDLPNELFSAHNGILMHTVAEELFDNGILRIIPSVENMSSLEEMRDWQKKEPKEYKIEIATITKYTPSKLKQRLETEIPSGEVLLGKKIIWTGLHGRLLEFKNDFRPRARYLYF
jgi:hypothetical protein